MRGLDEIKRRAAELKRRYELAAKTAVYLTANNVMAVAKERTPLDLGPLRASAFVAVPEMDGSAAVCRIGYDGPAAKYAVYQHETIGLNHPEPGTDAKFLESAIDDARSTAPQEMRAFFAQVLDTGQGQTSGGGFPPTPDQGRPVPGSARRAKHKAARKRAATRARKAARRAKGGG